MRTKHTLTIPALAASLLLGLTACGSSDNNDPIKSADSKPSHSAEHKSTSPNPSNSTPTGKPTFHFPKDVKVKIETQKTGDPTKDKILQDHRYAMMAEEESLAQGKPKENFQEYWTGQANIEYQNIFAEYKKSNLTTSGRNRFYSRRVVKHTKNSATIKFCEDESRAFDKNAETGKVKKTKATIDSYHKLTDVLKKSSSGTWQVTYEDDIRGDKKCRDAA